ncbi:MAG: adenylate/guanylate cyclase domain-containing protein [Burkholderiales bacterium]|nr:adenylate/guanylate cyclase domain-containing protein [Burkholderiales bacterium]MDE2394115.1 adenylate/guanylate cyclase domain-containing protein [Burkholderiales bacterium]MDE2454944.1 adenylate/guanylate cyclase domain-containing protein [Burkholderiales bacterium]
MIELGSLTMTEIIRLQGQLQQELTRRFQRSLLVMFSDIVGSTQYFARFGDAAGRQLQQLHADLLDAACRDCAGRIVEIAGDGCFLVFPSADSAVRAIILFHQASARANAERGHQHQLHVRIGLHWGSVLTDGVAVSGDAVNLCARVTSSADAGEIHLTRQVYQELGSSLRLNCHAKGTAVLKGVVDPVEIFGFEWRDHSVFPRSLRIEETGEEVALPRQDIVTFGRLPEHEGQRANDIVLNHPDPSRARRISRWHFELRRNPDGLHLRSLSDNATAVNGERVEKGVDTPVRAGSRILVADVLNLVLVGEDPGRISSYDATVLRLPTSRGSGG